MAAMTPVGAAKKILDTMLGHLGFHVEIEIIDSEEEPCLQIHTPRSELLIGKEQYPGKGYLYNLALVRGPLLWWGLVAAAWFVSRRAAERAAEATRAELAAEDLRARTAEARLQGGPRHLAPQCARETKLERVQILSCLGRH